MSRQPGSSGAGGRYYLLIAAWGAYSLCGLLWWAQADLMRLGAVCFGG